MQWIWCHHNIITWGNMLCHHNIPRWCHPNIIMIRSSCCTCEGLQVSQTPSGLHSPFFAWKDNNVNDHWCIRSSLIPRPLHNRKLGRGLGMRRQIIVESLYVTHATRTQHVSWLTRCPWTKVTQLSWKNAALSKAVSQPSPQQKWQGLNYSCLASGKAAGLHHTIGYISGEVFILLLVWTS